ncbi:MAG: ABC transporter permease, partial [Candidatus Bipolaricaulota bacterium]
KPPSKDHWLGTDMMGRDILTRVIFAARLSLMVGILTVLFGGTLGICMGTPSGYFGGWVESVVMRIVDIGLSFPLIILAILITAFFGGGLLTLVLAIGVTRSFRMARIAHAATRQVAEQDYISAAQGLGNSSTMIMIKHVLPNILAPVMVRATLDFAIVILVEASLSFLGLGIPPPTPSWGSLINSGRDALQTAPWISFSGGAALFITLVNANLVGDGLRDLLDPKVG